MEPMDPPLDPPLVRHASVDLLSPLVILNPPLPFSPLSMVTVYIISAQKNMTPLMAAAREGHVAIVKLLLSRGSEVNLKNRVRYSVYLHS